MIDSTGRTLSPVEAAQAFVDSGEMLFDKPAAQRIVADLLRLYEASVRERARLASSSSSKGSTST